jgi:hypothetical protein
MGLPRVPSGTRYVKGFFLEYAGELRIIVLSRKKYITTLPNAPTRACHMRITHKLIYLTHGPCNNPKVYFLLNPTEDYEWSCRSTVKHSGIPLLPKVPTYQHEESWHATSPSRWLRQDHLHPPFLECLRRVQAVHTSHPRAGTPPNFFGPRTRYK